MINLKVKDLQKQNKELREKLNEENIIYYEKLLVYIRYASYGVYIDEEIEETCLSILQDLIEAQEEGLTAEEFFGDNPKKAADGLLEEADRSILPLVKFILLVIVGLVLLGGSTGFIFPDEGIALFRLSVNGLLFGIAGLILFKHHKNAIYKKKGSYIGPRLYLVVVQR